MKEFQLGLQEDFNSDSLKLLPGDRIYVAYVWTWLSDDDDDDDDDDENRLSDDDPDSDDNVVTHTVTFKCIGQTKTKTIKLHYKEHQISLPMEVRKTYRLDLQRNQIIQRTQWL